MKRIVILALGLIFVIVPISALGQSLMSSTGWFSTSYTPLVSSDEGYYFVDNEFLYYVDNSNLEPVLLCSRLDCMHLNESNPKNCDAYIGEFSSIGLFDNQLFCLQSEYAGGQYYNAIVCMQPDGSQHREYIRLNDFGENIFYDQGFKNSFYFYTVGTIYMPSGAKDASDFQIENSLYAIDLRKGNSSPILIDTWNDADENIFLNCLNDEILFYVKINSDGVRTLFEYNLTTFSESSILEYSDRYSFFSINDSLYVLSSQTGIMKYNIDNKSMETIFLFESEADKGFIKTDGQYFYVFEKLNKEMNTINEALVINYDGDIVNRIELPEPLLLAFASDNYLLLQSAVSSSQLKYAIRKSELNSHEVQIISLTHP